VERMHHLGAKNALSESNMQHPMYGIR
jgi:hypothetical protein